ncbi:MAG: hypothetical protein ACTFAL_15535 [Candidatus Electronema sp. V4]|uniref:hypothetical protein n=1 Tax=Candidatus Electronema sp. V4 TaxID=3454756 RepID=UPI0040553C99
MAVAMTFEQVVETVRQCSPEQRGVLSDLMRRWEIEAVRREIAEDAKESLELFHQGILQPQSATEAIQELLEYLSNQE